jgi:flagellar hook-length control protein FliK
MSAAREGPAAQGVDQMARQLGLLRSIQQASAAADVVEATAPPAVAQQQAALAYSTSAAAVAEAALDGAASAPVSGAPGAVGASEGGAASGATTLATTVALTATVETGMSSGEVAGSVAQASAVATPKAAGLSASVSTEGLLSAEFVPGPSLKDDNDAGSVGAQPTLSDVDSATVEPGGRVTAQSEVAEGFAQAARAFDQANAIAQARIARVTQENRQAAIPSGGVPTAATSAQAALAGMDAASTGSRTISESGTANSTALAQSIQVAQSGVVLSGVSLSAGLTGASTTLLAAGLGIQGAAPDGGLTVASLASGPMEFAGAGSGGGSGTGGGSGDGSSSGSSARFTAGGLVGGAESGSVGSSGLAGAGISMATPVTGVADATVSSEPGAGVASAVTFQALGGSLRAEAGGATVTTQSPFTADQLPVALDQTAIDLARLRGGTLTLELAPADLGRLSFEMRIDDSGSAYVAIRLADDTVRALVENAAGALRDSLSREGFKLDSFTVSSGLGSPEQRENGQNQAFAETPNRRMRASDSSEGSRDSVQSRVSNTQVRPGTSSLSLFA